MIDLYLLAGTWAYVGVASEPSLGGEGKNKTGRQSTRKRASLRGRRGRGRGSPENAGAGTVGDVRLAPASRLG